MKYNNRLTSKIVSSYVFKAVFALFVMASATMLNAQTINLEPAPLFLANNVGTNIVVSMDDSGSMGWGFSPDNVQSSWDRLEYRSSYHNKAYYDPRITYNPPVTSTGEPESDAAFTAATRGYYYPGVFQETTDLTNGFAAIYLHYSYNNGYLNANGSLLLLNNIYTSWCVPDTRGSIAVQNPCTDQAAYYYWHYTQFIDDASPADDAHFSDGVPVPPAGCTANSVTDPDCYEKIVITDTSLNGTDGAYDGPDNGNGPVNDFGRSVGEEQTNFANWYQYYSIRSDSAKSALRLAFNPANIRSNVRVARQTLNNDTTVGSASTNFVAELDSAERDDFFNWINAIPTNGGTPLRNAAMRAGEFFRNNAVYRQDPQSPSSTIASCRINTHILVTDGVYNGGFDSGDISGTFNHDNRNVTLPSPAFNYDPTDTTVGVPVYRNSSSNTLADIIFHYWATDLQTGLANNVPAFFAEEQPLEGFIEDGDGNATIAVPDFWNPKNDPATWQHMTTFVVSFGLTGEVPFDSTTYSALLQGNSYDDNNGASRTGWPDAGTDSGKIDDLYHAGLSGRGGFFSATDPNQLVDAFGAITSRIEAMQSVASPVVANSGRATIGSLVYLASFDSENWSGRLRALEISDGLLDHLPDDPANCSTLEQAEFCSDVPLWDAAVVNNSDNIDPLTRRIFSYSDTSVVGGAPNGTGVEFRWPGDPFATSNIDATQQALLINSETATNGQLRLNYIRGDASEEGTTFRVRPEAPAEAAQGAAPIDNDGTNPNSRLGAITHSSPVYVGNGLDVNGLRQFDFDDGLESASYTDFLTTITDRPPLIYVGANDGMLHAFRADTGVEEFSYVPNMVFPELHSLTETTFGQGSYVDGPIKVQDVFIGGSWKTLLVGGMRLGGQGYYVLDITDPTLTDPEDVVKWEFTDRNDPDMGYSFGAPQIVRANNGEWVVIVASGYNSTVADGNVGSGRAALFILSADDGSVIAKFSLANPNGVTAPNGLSDPVAVNADDDINAEYVYAGDLQGNMWKFDISSANPADWRQASLIYSAGATSPITVRPKIGSHPANRTGRILYFGTGKYLEASDVTNVDLQKFYGLLDDDTCPYSDTGTALSTASSTSCLNSSDFVSQSITGYTPEGNRNTTSNSINWNTNTGWAFDLDTSALGIGSEKVVYRAELIDSVVVFLSTIPSGDICGSGGYGFMYALDRNSGAMPSEQIWDTNGDGVITDADRGNGVRVDEFGSGLSTISGSSGTSIITGFVDSEGLAGSVVNTARNSGKSGRVRWRRLK